MADHPIKCASGGCAPVVQTRGTMGDGDYFGVMSDGSNSSSPPYTPAIDHYKFVDPPHDGNRNDIRIACRKCALQTGWVQPDLANMPGVGRTFCFDQWKRLVEDKNLKTDMVDAMTEKFGADAVKKHFGRAL